MHISELIKDYRKRHNITLRDLSSITGISYSQLSKIERGESQPSNQTVLRFLDIFDVELTSEDLHDLIDVTKYLKNNNELIRYEVLSRDYFICQLCGAKAPNVQVDIDEIIPTKNDDKKAFHIDNLVTLCANCRRARHILLTEKGLDNDFLFKKYNKGKKMEP